MQCNQVPYLPLGKCITVTTKIRNRIELVVGVTRCIEIVCGAMFLGHFPGVSFQYKMYCSDWITVHYEAFMPATYFYSRNPTYDRNHYTGATVTEHKSTSLLVAHDPVYM